MLPHFTHMAGLWALLGIPAVIAIHFLQHKTRERTTATLFLLEAMAPEDLEGRAWERLRTSRPFWMQILAVLLLAWVLAAPCWPREDAHQTAVFVLDESADMAPFRKEAIRAVHQDMDAIRKTGVPTTWILLGSSPSGMPFYRGTDSVRALQALENWQPKRTTHNLSPSLGTAASLAGTSGITRLVTSTPLRVPPGQCARGVGKPLDNVGFAGIAPAENTAGDGWRIAVKNNSLSPVRKTIAIHAGEGKTPYTRQISIRPGTVSEFQFRLPPGCDRAMLELPPDNFPADDTLLLVRTKPKPISIHSLLPGPEERTFRKIWESIPGFSVEPSLAAALHLAAEDRPRPEHPAIILAANGTEASGKVTAEQHPLTDGLNWSGLLIPAIGHMVPGEKASILLWMRETPLAWVENESLYLNWLWRESNAERVAAPLLLIRRFMKSVQDQAPGTHSGNLPGGSLLPLPQGKIISQTMPDGERRKEIYSGRLPEQSSFIEILPSATERQPLFYGSVWFSDARMGDFSHCATFDTGLPSLKEKAQRQMNPDPLSSVWLCLAGLCLIVSWLPSASSSPSRP